MRFVLALALVLTLLGAPATSAPADEPAVEPAVEHALRIATFNCWGLPLIAKLRQERLAKLPSALQALKLDVICLQEMWLSGDQKTLAAKLAETHPHVARATGGLMVLSRFPLSTQRFVRYPDYPGLSAVERYAGKGLLDVTVKAPSGPIHVVTTHMALVHGEDNARTKQLGFLLEHIKPYAKKALFVLGDFNTGTSWAGVLDPQYERIRKTGLEDTCPPRKSKDGAWLAQSSTRIPWPRTPKALRRGWDPDHIFYRSGASLTIRKRSFKVHFGGIDDALSDHNLLAAEFVVQTKQKE